MVSRIRMNENLPRVSVVVPAYNQAQFLEEAIESVLAQTYTDYEIIVVDDGSTDETSQVARFYKDEIRYIWQENRGLAGARNTGIHCARGEYVALLDSDDWWMPNYLEVVMEQADQHPKAAVFYTGWRYMDAEGRELPQAAALTVVPPQEMYLRMLRGNFLIPSTITMRRANIVKAGMFDAGFRRLEDRELWLRLLRSRETFMGIPKDLVRYRLHGASLSTNSARMRAAVSTLVAKHFGRDDGQPGSWPEEKRLAYAGAYRSHALTFLTRDGDWNGCAASLKRALQVDPSIASDRDFFYELALGTQPLGYRGTSHYLELEENAEHTQRVLDAIFQSTAEPGLLKLRSTASATAYFALGIAAYHQGLLDLSRRYLVAALRYRCDLLLNRQALAFLLKTLIGRSNLELLRRFRHALR